MNSEKVKEIKKGLECCKQNEIEDTCKYCLDCPASDWDYEKECKIDLFQKTLTLINELESENETIKLNIQETEKASFNINQMNGNLILENQVLKDRIAELEKEVEDRKAEVLHLQEYGKKLIRETELKQFADKLKEKCHNYYPSIDHYCCSEKAVNVNDINELLKGYEND